jgi:pimeloyl-ACP methyl ester carboxylesterase
VLDIEPFRSAVDPAVLADLRERIARTRWPADLPGPLADDWSYGTEPSFLRGLLDAWREFDWAAYERRLNELPQFRARVDDLDVHFVHVRGTGPDPVPIVLTNGWPSSFLEYLELIPLVGRDFDVVVPSLPGFGFSGVPARPGVASPVVADVWHRLMTEGLGYRRFAAHGSDIGAGVTAQLGLRHPADVIGVHLCATVVPPPAGELTEDEQRYFAELGKWRADESSYLHQQGTKPQTLAYGLADSPAGLAGWIVEKYRDWSDSHGDVVDRIGLERLLATLTLYWVTGTITSSTRMYYENQHHGAPLDAGHPVPVPAGFSLFPNEFRPIPSPPRSIVERYFRVERWNELPRGGHFAALEEPALLAEELRAFFTPALTPAKSTD